MPEIVLERPSHISIILSGGLWATFLLSRDLTRNSHLHSVSFTCRFFDVALPASLSYTNESFLDLPLASRRHVHALVLRTQHLLLLYRGNGSDDQEPSDLDAIFISQEPRRSHGNPDEIPLWLLPVKPLQWRNCLPKVPVKSEVLPSAYPRDLSPTCLHAIHILSLPPLPSTSFSNFIYITAVSCHSQF
ncbi:hypothetical protein LZ30DRAFT_697473 [Colletotrichum cereale]|nr:hypothetical protein LZ30DRAFT_697473 [Colletotrichum cereale]